MSHVLKPRVSRLSMGLLALLALTVIQAAALAGDWKGKEEMQEGVLHVMNPSEPQNGSTTVALEELWRLGGDSDDEDEFFGVVLRLDHDEDGNVYVLDAQLNEVKVYNSDGEFLRSIGREGEGPGEFRRPTDLFFMPNGEVGVLQAAPPKIVMLTKDGDPAGDFPTPAVEGEGFGSISGARLAGDQLVYLCQAGNFDQETGTFIQTMSLRGADAKGEVVSKYWSESRVWEFANPVITETKWDNIQSRWQVGKDGRVYGCPTFEDYAISVWNPDGTLDRIIEAEHTPHKRTAEELERQKKVWEVFTRQAPNSTLDMSETDKPVGSIFTRDDGSLWVINSHGARLDEEGVLGSFDVYDKAGRFVREVTLTGEGNPLEDGYFFVGDRLYVVTEWLSAVAAMQGGGAGIEEDEEAEPMAIICYQLDESVLAMSN